jgi:26S proteasome regulatory subunit N7
VKLSNEAGGDWDKRNRLKVYSALNKLLIRDLKGAASLLVDCIATFSCNEFCSYTDFVIYAILTNILYLPRTELKSKIVDGPEILSIINDIPVVYKLVSALYECDYRTYLHTIVELQPILTADRFLQPHSGYILRELHVLGYKQFLESYKSVTLESMAMSFGVGTTFLDLQLSRFIAAGRLTAKIDKFGGVVETTRPDLKNSQYRDTIQKGDLLLNRIQKLARVVDL